MSNPLQFSVEIGKATPELRRSAGEPLRILYIADLGESCQSRTSASVDERPIFPVDIDTFDTILARERPSAHLGFSAPSGEDIRLEFEGLDDFHPDRIFRSTRVFDTLKDLRQRLRSPDTFEAAARELRSSQAVGPSGTETASADESDAETLERLFGKTCEEDTPQAQPNPGALLNDLIREAVASHIAPQPDPRVDQYLNAVDSAARQQMRAILHDHAFQSLEAGWRGLDFLVSNTETDEDLQIFLLNASKSELADVLANDESRPELSPMFRRLVEQREGERFSLIVSDIAFGPRQQDLLVLAGLGVIAQGAGALVLASVAPEMIGGGTWDDVANRPDSLTEQVEGWATLRSSEVAKRITLVAPGFLLRSPYGEKLDPIDAFDFEELVDPAQEQGAFLWGPPALVATVLIGRSFRDSDWNLRLNSIRQLDDLPMVTYEFQGTQQLRPCAEALLPDRSVDAVLLAGPVPLVANRTQSAVRLPFFQTISDREGFDSILGPFRA